MSRHQQARRVSDQQQADLALRQGLALCDEGEVKHGLLWLARSLQLATSARAEGIDRAIRINVAEWEEQLCRPWAHLRLAAPIADLAFSPDGRSLVAIDGDHRVRIGNAAAAAPDRPMMAETISTERPVRRISVVPRGAGLLAMASDDGRVALWDLVGRRMTGTALVHPPGVAIRGMVPGPDGRRLITRGDDGSIRCWDVETGGRVGETLQHGPGVGDSSLALSPDGRILITGGEDGLALRWELATGRRIDPPMRHDAPISAIAYSRDGQAIITGTRDGRLHVWDSGATRAVELPAQGTAVAGLAVSPSGESFAAGTAGGVVHMWDLNMLRHPVQTTMLAEAITRVAFHPGGQILATGQDDGTIRLWALPPSRAVGRPMPVSRPVECLSFGEDGSRILVGGDGGARRWDLDRGIQDGDAEEARSGADATVLGPDGKVLAIVRRTSTGGPGGGLVELRDVATGRRLRATPEQSDPLVGVAFSPDSQRLLTWGHRPRSALLWDVATLREARPVLQTLDASVHRAVFRPDGSTLLVGCRDGTGRLWDVEDDEEINPGLRPHHAYPVTALAFPPRGEKVATGCQDGTVGMWDLSSGKLLFETRGKPSEVTAMTFSPDGRTLMRAGRDGTVQFLDAESGRPLGPPLYHSDAVLVAAFHPDGRSVATGTKDGKVRRWRVPRPPAGGTPDEIRRRLEDQIGLWLDYQGVIHTLAARPGLRDLPSP